MKKALHWRLGVDLGANSLGWAAILLEGDDKERDIPIGFLATGSRIFGSGANGAGRDAKSGASLAVARRDARAMRRRRDRFKQRQAALIKYLIRDGLFPADADARKALEQIDPYALRARALDEALSLPELGRALFHLNQRRGFQSNRKADRKDGEEAGKVSVGIDRLRDKIAEKDARTFGELLHILRTETDDPNRIQSVRTRLRPETGEGAKGDGYDFYPGRALVQEEFDAIWDAQAPHHPETLTGGVHDRLYEIIFHQRPLRTPQIGMCTLVPGERRLPKAHPLFQRRRLLEELNNLKIVRPGEVAVPLTREQRDLLLLKLKDKRKVSFATLRNTLKLDSAARFNKESENRTELKGDEVAAEMGAKTRFGPRWVHLTTDQQEEIITRQQAVESDADDAAFRAWLTETYDFDPAQDKATANANLPAGYGRFGLTATTKLIAALTDELDADGKVITYDKAVLAAGLGHHSDHRTGEIFTDAEGRPALPYYGTALERHIMPGTGDPSDPDETRIGRLTNPTVHIGLNQLRRIVNRLIRAYGPPAEIAIELARDINKSEEEKREDNKRNTANRREAERRSETLRQIGQPDTGANRARLKLWEELNLGNILDRRCVYSGTQISIDMLFSASVEIDHILPYAATLDDSNANKILCTTASNRAKRKQSPFQAWGHGDLWPEIAERASRLPKNKRWRFEPDAMERYQDEESFLARHLVDTQYLSRLAREYLSTLYPERGEGSSHVWVSPGRLTEIVRRKLGLNDLLPDHNFGGGAGQPKNRLDHRHHAIDAALVAVIDRRFLKKAQTLSGIEGEAGRDKIEFPEPWEGFREDLRKTVNAITVAHRNDHGTVSKVGLKPGRDQTAGRLHNDTAYGITGEKDAKGNSIVVNRVLLTSLKSGADIDRVREPDLRRKLHDFMDGHEGKAFEARIQRFHELGDLTYRGIRRVRVVQPLKVIPIRDANGKIYKGYKGDSNYRYDVWELPDGKWITQWTDRDGIARSSIVSMFDAHQSGAAPRPHPAARKGLSFQRDDILAVERDGAPRELMRVVKYSEKQLALAPPNEAGALKARDADREDPFKYVYPSPGTLKKWRARQVRIDEIGRVMDPGFPAITSTRKARIRARAAAD